MGCKRWGSFEEWSSLVPNAIVFAGGADPMLARPEKDADVDVEAQALSCLLDQLPALHIKAAGFYPDEVSADGIPARTIVSSLYEQFPEWTEFESLRNAIETLCKPKFGKAAVRPDPVSLGYKLRSMRSRVVGGRKLVARAGAAHSTVWMVEQN